MAFGGTDKTSIRPGFYNGENHHRPHFETNTKEKLILSSIICLINLNLHIIFKINLKNQIIISLILFCIIFFYVLGSSNSKEGGNIELCIIVVLTFF